MIKTVLQTIQDGTAYLEKRGVENGRLNMEHLLAHVLKCKRMQLYLWFDRPLVEAELVPLRELTLRRGKREPLQHLLGTVEFHGREFLCDARALIPRPETEELVERILKLGRQPVRILDMGTGSGVIGISLGLAWPEAEVTLAELSADALALAGENAAHLGRAVHGVESDLWSALTGETFDLVAANLPYISTAEVAELEPEVQRDPALALDGGAVGLELMMRFISSLRDHLELGGTVAMEIGRGQGASLQQALEHCGMGNVRVVHDYSRRERFVFAESI